jgi:AcrR family transcriptional regulator
MARYTIITAIRVICSTICYGTRWSGPGEKTHRQRLSGFVPVAAAGSLRFVPSFVETSRPFTSFVFDLGYGTVYHYYGNKGDLLHDLLWDALERSGGWLEAPGPSSAVAAVSRLLLWESAADVFPISAATAKPKCPRWSGPGDGWRPRVLRLRGRRRRAGISAWLWRQIPPARPHRGFPVKALYSKTHRQRLSGFVPVAAADLHPFTRCCRDAFFARLLLFVSRCFILT